MDKLEKIAEALAKLGDRYDEEALLEGGAKILERAHKALEDGRVTIFEGIGIGLAVLDLLRSARRS